MYIREEHLDICIRYASNLFHVVNMYKMQEFGDGYLFKRYKY